MEYYPLCTFWLLRFCLKLLILEDKINFMLIKLSSAITILHVYRVNKISFCSPQESYELKFTHYSMQCYPVFISVPH